MKPQYVFIALVALCTAMTGGSASADDRTPDQVENPAADSPATDNGQGTQLQFTPGKTMDELRIELSRPLTPEQAAAARAQTERDSSLVHYYPEAPDDSRTEPPPLNDQGEEKPNR